jgi:hypothetical protein
MGCGISSLTKGRMGEREGKGREGEGLPWPQADAGGSHTPLYGGYPFQTTHKKGLDDLSINSPRSRAEPRAGGRLSGQWREEPQMSQMGYLRAMESRKEDQDSMFTAENSPLQSDPPSAMHAVREVANGGARKLEEAAEKSKLSDWLKKSVLRSGHSAGRAPCS